MALSDKATIETKWSGEGNRLTATLQVCEYNGMMRGQADVELDEEELLELILQASAVLAEVRKS